METCMTLGMLEDNQVLRLKGAGLDYYNHNIDTSERYYSEIITTRTFADRIDTLDRVRAAGIKGLCRRHRRHGRATNRPCGHATNARHIRDAS